MSGRCFDNRISLADPQGGDPGVRGPLTYLPSRERRQTLRVAVKVRIAHPNRLVVTWNVLLDNEVGGPGGGRAVVSLEQITRVVDDLLRRPLAQQRICALQHDWEARPIEKVHDVVPGMRENCLRSGDAVCLRPEEHLPLVCQRSDLGRRNLGKGEPLPQHTAMLRDEHCSPVRCGEEDGKGADTPAHVQQKAQRSVDRHG